MRAGRARERGFTLVEMMIVLAILGVLMTGLFQMIQTLAKASVRAAVRESRRVNESDMRRLYDIVRGRGPAGGSYPSAGPWPQSIPVKSPVDWVRPAPGFDELGWAPSKSPVMVQYALEGWATGFIVSAIGDLDRDGGLEAYRISGDVGMFEGPLPYPPEQVSPLGQVSP